MFRQIQIDADDVYQVFCELGIVADLEALHPGRFSGRDCARCDAR
jgi:hypothetical protein